jgi:DNA-binding IscR family transcriptional regulator
VAISECRLQPLMQHARDAVANVLENCSLEQLAKGPTSRGRRRPARATSGPSGVPRRKAHTTV